MAQNVAGYSISTISPKKSQNKSSAQTYTIVLSSEHSDSLDVFGNVKRLRLAVAFRKYTKIRLLKSNANS